jgi:hypothetical protein
MPFAIIQECTVTHRQHYVSSDAITSVTGGCPARMTFSRQDAAEFAARTLRDQNAANVERTKRQRKYRVHPCTYTVVAVVP